MNKVETAQQLATLSSMHHGLPAGEFLSAAYVYVLKYYDRWDPTRVTSRFQYLLVGWRFQALKCYMEDLGYKELRVDGRQWHRPILNNCKLPRHSVQEDTPREGLLPDSELQQLMGRGLSYKAMAYALGCPVGTIKSRIARERACIR